MQNISLFQLVSEKASIRITIMTNSKMGTSDNASDASDDSKVMAGDNGGTDTIFVLFSLLEGLICFAGPAGWQ